MARRKRSDFVVAAKREPFELEIGNEGEYVTFRDPAKLPTSDAFQLANEDDAKKILSLLLGDDFAQFWTEWKDVPVDETNGLIAEVMTHYGTDPK